MNTPIVLWQSAAGYQMDWEKFRIPGCRRRSWISTDSMLGQDLGELQPLFFVPGLFAERAKLHTGCR